MDEKQIQPGPTRTTPVLGGLLGLEALVICSSAKNTDGELLTSCRCLGGRAGGGASSCVESLPQKESLKP